MNKNVNKETKAALRKGEQISRGELRALLGEIVRDYPSMRACAKSWKISPAYLSDCLRDRRNPGPAILDRMGLRKVETVRYVRGAMTNGALTNV